MKNHSKLSYAFIVLATFLLIISISIVSYKWGYMQNAIDNHIAAFSAPASIALLQGVPYWMAAAIFIAISIYLKNKKPWKS